MIRVCRRLGGPKSVCRVLSGQRYPEVGREQGVAWVVEAITKLLPVSAGKRRGPRHGEPLQGRLLEIPRIRPEEGRFPGDRQRHFRSRIFRGAIRSLQRHRGRRRPGGAAAGRRPTASSPCTPATATSPRARRWTTCGRRDGTLGYSPNLRHGVTGKGLNDYDAIFRILADHRYKGWVSIEDGMNGMGEMAESLAFLRRMSEEVFSGGVNAARAHGGRRLRQGGADSRRRPEKRPGGGVRRRLRQRRGRGRRPSRASTASALTPTWASC